MEKVNSDPKSTQCAVHVPGTQGQKRRSFARREALA